MAIKLIPGESQNKRNGMSIHPLISNLDNGNNQSTLPLSVNSVVVEAGSESVMESHESVEMWVVVRGEGLVSCKGVDYDAQAGDVFYFDPLVEHKVKNNGNKSMLITSVWCKNSA